MFSRIGPAGKEPLSGACRLCGTKAGGQRTRCHHTHLCFLHCCWAWRPSGKTAKSRILSGRPQLLLWIGLCAGWTNLAYVLGVIHGEIMRVMLLFYLAPLWTIVFSRLLLDEVLSLHGYLVMVFSGAMVMLWRRNRFFDLPSSYGAGWDLSAGFMFALSNVLSRMDQVHNTSKSLAVWMGVTLIAFRIQPVFTAAIARQRSYGRLYAHIWRGAGGVWS